MSKERNGPISLINNLRSVSFSETGAEKLLTAIYFIRYIKTPAPVDPFCLTDCNVVVRAYVQLSKSINA